MPIPFEPAAAFVERSRELLRHTYLPKVRAAVEALPGDDDVWWRPGDDGNAIGTLLVHMAGNMRQYIASGIGGAPLVRDRDAEFATVGGRTRDAVLADFTAAVRECDAVLAALDPATLGTRALVQGRELTRLELIYQVVEHVAGHVGQVIQLAKWRAPGAIRFYEASTHGVQRLWDRDDTP
ncbi:MAG: DUF1572 domain-containing protein [Gemmatimonadaceae bacterium]|jgi:hypothetical protein|nr:DUF1572 domain-containing protein [Gemmatimonadaceae bacterium]